MAKCSSKVLACTDVLTEKKMGRESLIVTTEGAQYATGDQWRNNSRKKERMEPKQNNTQLWM